MKVNFQHYFNVNETLSNKQIEIENAVNDIRK